MSELRTGLDLCEISRMERMTEHPRFLERCLTEGERAWLAERGKQKAASLAGLWAAKEALLKALGTGLELPMREVEILHGANGEPFYQLHGEAARRAGEAMLSLSITHDGGIAAAVCVLLRI